MKWPLDNYMKLDACIHGKVYALASRNINIGIFDSETANFIGIRTKFGNRYLDMEEHWDNSLFGTAMPVYVLDCELPSNVFPFFTEEKYLRDNQPLFEFLLQLEKTF